MQTLDVSPFVPSDNTAERIEKNRHASRLDLERVLPGSRSQRRSK